VFGKRKKRVKAALLSIILGKKREVGMLSPSTREEKKENKKRGGNPVILAEKQKGIPVLTSLSGRGKRGEGLWEEKEVPHWSSG